MDQFDVRCPWCTVVIDDLWEFFTSGDGTEEIECPDCEKPINITQTTTVDYEIEKRESTKRRTEMSILNTRESADLVNGWRCELHDIIEEEEYQVFFQDEGEGTQLMNRLIAVHDEMARRLHAAPAHGCETEEDTKQRAPFKSLAEMRQSDKKCICTNSMEDHLKECPLHEPDKGGQK